MRPRKPDQSCFHCLRFFYANGKKRTYCSRSCCHAALKGGKSIYPREYRIWTNMKTRCCNTNNRAYRWYGGRGIGICDEWRDDFDKFLKDMGRCPDGMTLERVDNSQGYCSQNCRWASYLEQNNNRRSNKTLELGGVTKTYAQWDRYFGLPLGQISRMVRSGKVTARGKQRGVVLI